MTAQIIMVDVESELDSPRQVEVWAQRLSYAGELGWELYVARDDAPAVWDALIATGEPYDIRPVGYKALDSLRLEKGYRVWGSDITPDENPYEAGLGFCVRLKSGGEFIGKQALLQARKEGHERRLCTLTLYDDGCVLYGGEAVYAREKLVGRVRSAGYGYTVGKNIALTYLPLEFAGMGSGVQVEVFGELIEALVVPDTLYDAEGRRLRQM